MIRVNMEMLCRIPLNGTFNLRYQPYTPHAAILYRTDCDQGIFVDPDPDTESAYECTVRGSELPKTGFVHLYPDGKWDEEHSLRAILDIVQSTYTKLEKEGI